eukprot:TRINITY_DN1418_c0_g1_i9.p1 TRINITY_DN1418_c0_g1~~TRINITY_DN1418_c0_g1_i9.p1  ORF type:complete len:587 (-),score=142.70 TRINITY_DN1418_c0_g1_i9:441-2201(-)
MAKKTSGKAILAACAVGTILNGPITNFAVPNTPAEYVHGASVQTARTAEWTASESSFAGADLKSELMAGGLLAIATVGMMRLSNVRRRAQSVSLVRNPEEMYQANVATGGTNMVEDNLFWKGLATGFYIGIGGLLCCTVGNRCTGLPIGLKDFLFGAIGFPMSIFLTINCGGSGFTPNIALGVSALVKPDGLLKAWRGRFFKKNAKTEKEMLRGAFTEQDYVAGMGQLGISENRARYTYNSAEPRRNMQRDGFPQITVGTLLNNWSNVYIGNFVGLTIMSLLANLASLPAVESAINVAQHKCSLTFVQVFFRGILGGWLINLAVWASSAGNSCAEKLLIVWLCISTYVVCHFEHCLANIIFCMMALFSGKSTITFTSFVTKSLIPSTLGNLIGGIAMVSLVYRKIYGDFYEKNEESLLPKMGSMPNALLNQAGNDMSEKEAQQQQVKMEQLQQQREEEARQRVEEQERLQKQQEEEEQREREERQVRSQEERQAQMNREILQRQQEEKERRQREAEQARLRQQQKEEEDRRRKEEQERLKMEEEQQRKENEERMLLQEEQAKLQRDVGFLENLIKKLRQEGESSED